MTEARNMIAEPAHILAWAEGAAPRDVFLYATRCFLPLGSAGAATMRTLQARGLVNLCQRPVGDEGARNYEAQRTSMPWPVAPARKPTLRSRGGEVDPEVELFAIDQLMPILTRAARFRRPCPTDADMARRASVERDAVAAGLAALKALNLIRVQSAPAPTLRRVTIVQTGHQTGYAA